VWQVGEFVGQASSTDSSDSRYRTWQPLPKIRERLRDSAAAR
jgi:hypothetical protein